MFTLYTEAHSYALLPLLDLVASVWERLRGCNSGHVGDTTGPPCMDASVSTVASPGRRGGGGVALLMEQRRLQGTGHAAACTDCFPQLRWPRAVTCLYITPPGPTGAGMTVLIIREKNRRQI